jgi:hypothetical protein
VTVLPPRIPPPCLQSLKRAIEVLWWDNLRSPDNIRRILQLVYANPAAVDDALVTRIIQSTQHPRAIDAFTSIVLAPKTQLTFDQMLAAVRCPLVMAYGEWEHAGGWKPHSSDCWLLSHSAPAAVTRWMPLVLLAVAVGAVLCTSCQQQEWCSSLCLGSAPAIPTQHPVCTQL